MSYPEPVDRQIRHAFAGEPAAGLTLITTRPQRRIESVAEVLRWLRFFEQNLCVDKWNSCPGFRQRGSACKLTRAARVCCHAEGAARRSKLDRACAGQARSEGVGCCKIPNNNRSTSAPPRRSRRP